MKRLLLAGAALLGLAVLGLAWAVWRTFPREAGSVETRGHAAPIRIETDAHGVPTIRAQSVPDAFFGLGYAHAKDRLWQMEFQRRIGAGRLSEILGAGALPADRFLRTVGFRRAAESAWKSLADPQKRLLEAYAAGVNAFLAADGARPIEFRILRVAPEPWKPEDSLAWAKMMAWDLAGNAREEIRRAQFAAAVGSERASELLPLAASEPTILAGGEWLPAATPDLSGSRLPTPGPWSSLERAFASLDPLGLAAGGRSRQQLLGPRRVPKRDGPSDPRQRPAPGAARALGLVPGFPRRPGTARGRRDAAGRARRDHRAQRPDRLGTDVARARRAGPVRRGGRPRDPPRYRHRGEWRSFETRVETDSRPRRTRTRR